MNQSLLVHLMTDVEKHGPQLLQRILTASTEHGMYGMQLLRALHDQVPKSRCGDCGDCCNAVSIYSLEYHLVVRDLLTRLPPQRIRALLLEALRIDRRLAEVGEENRLRCVFRDNERRLCLIHPARPFPCRIFGLLREGTPRECDRVQELDPCQPLQQAFLDDLQVKVMSNSESFSPFPGLGEIAFFPFEFWLYRYSLGIDKALELYREILVPASTPLSDFWKAERQRTAEGNPSLVVPPPESQSNRSPSRLSVPLVTPGELDHLRQH